MGNDAARLDVREFDPSGAFDPNPVLFIPALGVEIGYYEKMLTAWAESSGRRIVAADLRATPPTLSSAARMGSGYSMIIRELLPAVASTSFLREQSFAVVGHSLGGQLALLATAAGTITPSGVVAVASGTSSTPAMSSTAGRLKRRLQVEFARSVISVLGMWPGDRLGFGGRQTRDLMRDWCHEGRHGRYRLQHDDFDYETALGAITQPVLLLELNGDRIITPQATEHLASRLPRHLERQTVLSAKGEPFDHIRWVRQEPEMVIAAIDGWLPNGSGQLDDDEVDLGLDRPTSG